MIISIGSDHAGFQLKEYIIKYLEKQDIEIIDSGCFNEERCDYPDFANKVCGDIIDKNANFGILICNTGIGMSMCANRHLDIRAALCLNPMMAEKTRHHNDANILVLGSSMTTPEDSRAIIDTFLAESFEGGRHKLRLEKFS